MVRTAASGKQIEMGPERLAPTRSHARSPRRSILSQPLVDSSTSRATISLADSVGTFDLEEFAMQEARTLVSRSSENPSIEKR